MPNNDWKTLRVPPEAYDEAKAAKERNDRTWGEQLTAGGDDADAVDAEALAATVDQLAESLTAVEERTGRIERMMEDLQR